MLRFTRIGTLLNAPRTSPRRSRRCCRANAVDREAASRTRPRGRRRGGSIIDWKRRSLSSVEGEPDRHARLGLGAVIANSPPGGRESSRPPTIRPPFSSKIIGSTPSNVPVIVDPLKPRVSTNVLASKPDDLERQPLGARPAEIEHRFLKDQPAAHERPFAALDLDQLVGQQLVADHAILDEDAGVDRLRPSASGPAPSQAEQIGEMDRAVVSPVTGPNGAARSMSGGREIAGRGDLAARRSSRSGRARESCP